MDHPSLGCHWVRDVKKKNDPLDVNGHGEVRHGAISMYDLWGSLGFQAWDNAFG